jgi:hypothetical protein
MKFLIRENFIYGRPVAANAPLYANVSLTAATLELLNVTPKSLQQHLTWGERLTSAAKSGAREVTAIVAKEFLHFAAQQAGLGPPAP